MLHTLVVSVPLLRQYLRELLRRPPGPLRLPVGVSRGADHLDVLVAAPGSATGRVLLLAWTETLTIPSVFPPDCIGALLLGRGQQHGRAHGVIRLPGDALTPLHQLRLVGSGMPVIPLQHTPLPVPLTRMSAGTRAQPTEQWSRTIGALGQATWERLVGLRYGIIGAGRTGSLMGSALATLGVRHLTLIDPDRVERHNLGETLGLTARDLACSKVEALAQALTAPAQAAVVAVPTSITRLQALHAAQACDVLISCVDHDSARLAATGIATVFCKPLLDIATGVHGHGAERQMGADIRLVLPGRCLCCFGGLRDEASAHQVLASAEAERAFYAQRRWEHERAGSLLSQNLVAVGRALQLLEALLDERIQESRWEHLESDRSAHLLPEYPVVPPAPASSACGLCALLGWGEEGIPRLVEFLQQGQRRQEHQPTRAVG